MGPTKAEPPPPPRRGPRLLRLLRFCPPGLPWLPDPFWPWFWLPKLRLRRRDLRLRGFCGWFNPSFIRIPVSFDLICRTSKRGDLVCAKLSQGLVGGQSVKFRKIFVVSALFCLKNLMRETSHRNGRLL